MCSRRGRRYACDVEGPRRPGDLIVARHDGAGTPFHEYWVLAEVTAKLLDMPILEWLNRERVGSVVPLPKSAHALVVRGAPGERTLAFGWMSAVGSRQRHGAHRGKDLLLGFCPEHVRVVQHPKQLTATPANTPLGDS